jgi:hypothetical protein
MYVAWRELVVDPNTDVMTWRTVEQNLAVSWPDGAVPIGACWQGQLVIAPKGGGSSNT